MGIVFIQALTLQQDCMRMLVRFDLEEALKVI